MPIYEYECLVCQKAREVIQRHNDTPLSQCPDCGGPMKKLISNSSFVLKGTGWYKTDYASTDKKTESKTDKKDNSKAESKPEKKPEPAAKTE